MINRILDIIVSCMGLLLLILVLPWIALFIKLDSRGPVFYRCNRVGQGGKIFQMLKFRTMYEGPAGLGPSVSPQGDPRVTPVGRVLRRLKLNEFPQFINVLKGDMTLIGPRPEAPDLAAAYPEAARRIFAVKPGLAGPNQILGRNEEELYPPGLDPATYYIDHILPRKLPLDLEYIDDLSILKNFKYLLLSLKVTITGAINRRHLADNRSQIYLLLCDMLLCLLSFSLAHFLRYESFSNRLVDDRAFLRLLPWVVLVRLPIFIYFGFYHTLIRHLSVYDIKRVFSGVAVSSVTLMGFSFLSGLALSGGYAPGGRMLFSQYARGVFVIDWCCLTILLVSYRALLKRLYVRHKAGALANGVSKRVLIWGAGDGGELCLRYLKKDKEINYEVVGFIDDEPRKLNRRLQGVKVLGNRHHLEILAKLYKIHEVFLAMPSVPVPELNQAFDICRSLGLPAKLFQLNAAAYPKPASPSSPESFHEPENETELSVVADQRR